MKIEVIQSFSGRPDEATDDFTMFLEGSTVEVPDAFGEMVVAKGLAKIARSKSPAEKGKPHETE
jgi:hypothetical protein